MRPSSSYHNNRSRYINKPVIINNNMSPPATMLPRARLINTSTSLLRPTIRHSNNNNNSYNRNQLSYYQPAIIQKSNSYGGSHHRNNNYVHVNKHQHSSSYHRNNHRNQHHNHNTRYSHSHHHHNHHRNDRDRNHRMHHHRARGDRGRGRGRDRIRSHRDRIRGNHHNNRMRGNNHHRSRSRDRNRFTSKYNNKIDVSSNNNHNISNEEFEINKLMEYEQEYKNTFNNFCTSTINKKWLNYYNSQQTPRFMIQNDTKFRQRIERLKGLNSLSINKNNQAPNKSDQNPKKNKIKTVKNKKKHSKKSKNDLKNQNKSDKSDKSIFNPAGKSSMNYKFRAFKNTGQSNSFVQENADANNGNKNVTKTTGIYNNIHVNDDDIYISHSDQIDMNELINGLVYSSSYQDYRIGTLNTAQNDYSQHFVDTGKRPQNFIRELQHIDRLREYPKLRKLMHSKNEALRKISVNTAPFYINTDLKTFDLSSLRTKFDVILVDPPWDFYVDRCPGSIENRERQVWTFNEMSNLRIQDIAENPSFLFLWCGNGRTLNDGRQLLKKWGYKRCEVIVWLKTNKKSAISLSCAEDGDNINDYILEYSSNEYDGCSYNNSLFVRTYEHCLMGIRGQVRRSTDGHLIHANVDTDVIITESAPYGSTMKPNELYDIIERFCLGRKRIELFGEKHNLRPGWLTISNNVPLNSNFDYIYYNSLFQSPNPRYVPSTNEIEALRPKSPVRINKNKNKHTHGSNNKSSFK